VQYTVEIVSKAEKEFLRLPAVVRSQICKKILSLEEKSKTKRIRPRNSSGHGKGQREASRLRSP
jgi:mRNA-degrading endonuclease RelE of RelBE toxin-antitoxin system